MLHLDQAWCFSLKSIHRIVFIWEVIDWNQNWKSKMKMKAFSRGSFWSVALLNPRHFFNIIGCLIFVSYTFVKTNIFNLPFNSQYFLIEHKLQDKMSIYSIRRMEHFFQFSIIYYKSLSYTWYFLNWKWYKQPNIPVAKSPMLYKTSYFGLCQFQFRNQMVTISDGFHSILLLRKQIY